MAIPALQMHYFSIFQGE